MSIAPLVNTKDRGVKAMAARTGRKRGRRRLSLFGRAVSAIIICVAIFLAVTIFFKVSTVYVEGESRYSSEEIIEASGVEVGTHMFLLNQSAIAASIQSKLYYVGEVSVRRNYPDRLTITVKDNAAVGYVISSGKYWLIDKKCKIMEVTDRDGVGSAAEISGIIPVLPKEGEIINVEESEASKVTYLADILTYAQAQGIIEDVTAIDMDNVSNPKFEYLDRFTVKLGANSDVEYKLQMLEGVIAELTETEKGTIDLSDASKVSFRPY